MKIPGSAEELREQVELHESVDLLTHVTYASIMTLLTAADRKLKGRTVRFRVRDIYHPQPASILHELHDEEQLRGRVLDLSDCAQPAGSPFVVVKVAGLRRECLVPVDRLLRRGKAPVEL
jgi:hypothetical protein